MSTNFGTVDLEHLTFPTTMSIDYVRVYQPKGSINVGCDPDDYPTKAYIEECVLSACLLDCAVLNLFIGISRRIRILI